jgi:hypothetical protein
LSGPAEGDIVTPLEPNTTEPESRLALVQRAFREFRSQCFWSYRDDVVSKEVDIRFVVRELRRNGGPKGYQIAAELCQP